MGKDTIICVVSGFSDENYDNIKGLSQLCIDMYEGLKCHSWMRLFQKILLQVPRQHWHISGYMEVGVFPCLNTQSKITGISAIG